MSVWSSISPDDTVRAETYGAGPNPREQGIDVARNGLDDDVRLYVFPLPDGPGTLTMFLTAADAAKLHDKLGAALGLETHVEFGWGKDDLPRGHACPTRECAVQDAAEYGAQVWQRTVTYGPWEPTDADHRPAPAGCP
jgi:hypothetical protein